MAKTKKVSFKKFKKLPLPRSLSGWILASVEDAKFLSRTRGFRLNMSVFNEFPQVYNAKKNDYVDGSVCEVCLGGSVLVRRGLVAPGDHTNGDNTSSLGAGIDSVRAGDLASSIQHLASSGYLPEWMGGVLPDELQTILASLGNRILEAMDGESDRAPWPVYIGVAKELQQQGL